MKKVALVYSGAKYQGGIENYLENLFKHYDKGKIDIVLISLGEWPLCEKVRKAKNRVIKLPEGRIRPWTFFDIKKIIRAEDIALVVSQGVVANFYSRIGAKLAHVPHLTTVHSDLRAEYTNPIIKYVYILSDFITKSISKKYIAASEYLKKLLILRGVRDNMVDVIYHGVLAPEIKEKHTGPIVVGSLGRLDKVKGYENLIQAFSMLENTDAKLVIWGDGKERDTLQSLIKELGLLDSVEMPGYIEDVGEVLSKIDIYIQPSLSEGLGLATVEASLARKPVIVTPIGGLKEIVRDGQTGFVAKSTKPKAIADAMKKVFDNFKDINKIVDRAEKEAKEKFSVDRCVRETERVYLETME